MEKEAPSGISGNGIYCFINVITRFNTNNIVILNMHKLKSIDIGLAMFQPSSADPVLGAHHQ